MRSPGGIKQQAKHYPSKTENLLEASHRIFARHRPSTLYFIPIFLSDLIMMAITEIMKK